jgi:tetratricopeptide (TPR) repeat protein
MGSLRFIPFFLLVACAENTDTKLQKFLLKGNLALEQGLADQAQYYYNQALAVDPCFADAHNNLGTLLYQQKKFEEAKEQYSKALECSPDFTDARYNRVNVLYRLKEYYGAARDLEMIEKVKPDTVWVHSMKGMVFTQLRDFPAAINSFTEAIRRDPAGEADHLVNRASVKFYMRQYAEAQRDLERAATLKPNEPAIYNDLAMIAVEYKEFDKALALANRALALAPGHAYYLNNRGLAYLGLGRLAEAEIDFNNSMAGEPDNGWVYRNKGIFYLLKNDYASAERLLVQAQMMDGFIDKLNYYLGMAYLYNGKKELACAAFRKSDELGEQMVTAELLKQCK